MMSSPRLWALGIACIEHGRDEPNGQSDLAGPEATYSVTGRLACGACLEGPVEDVVHFLSRDRKQVLQQRLTLQPNLTSMVQVEQDLTCVRHMKPTPRNRERAPDPHASLRGRGLLAQLVSVRPSLLCPTGGLNSLANLATPQRHNPQPVAAPPRRHPQLTGTPPQLICGAACTSPWSRLACRACC